ncbi:hypothetical protein C8R43DRAFT_1121785 [Mycena crocata]|nr:hypothetical protein C8R43DRAFT_1121785 [Mycena crocata]
MDARIRPPPKFTIFWGSDLCMFFWASSLVFLFVFSPFQTAASCLDEDPSTASHGLQGNDGARAFVARDVAAPTTHHLLLFNLASRALASLTNLHPGTRDASITPARQTILASRVQARRHWHLGEARERKLNVALATAVRPTMLPHHRASRSPSTEFFAATVYRSTTYPAPARRTQANGLESGRESGMTAAEGVESERPRESEELSRGCWPP